MVKLNAILLMLVLIGSAVGEPSSEDQVKLDVGDKVDIYFDKLTSQKISASLGELPEAFGALRVTGKIDRFEDGAFIATGEFGINGKGKQSLVRITVPVQPSQCKPVPERYRHQIGSEFSTTVLQNPSVKVDSTKGVKVERWERVTEVVLDESAK